MTNPQQGWNNSLQPGGAQQQPAPQQYGQQQYGQPAAQQHGQPAAQQYGQAAPYQRPPQTGSQPVGPPVGRPWPTLQPGAVGAVPLDASYPWGPRVQPAQPPADGRVVVAVHTAQMLLIGGLSLAAALGILYWQWYMGDLFDFDGADGRVTKGSIMFHIIPLVLIVVALVMAYRAIDRKPKIIFEARGIQYVDPTQPDGMAKRGWDQIGRVLGHAQPSGKSSVDHWIVLDRQGAVLVNLPCNGLAPKPEDALGQIATLSQGRSYIG